MHLYWPRPYWLRVFLSNKYVYAQVFTKDTYDVAVAASTIEPMIRSALKNASTSDKYACSVLSKILAERCKTKDIKELNVEFKHRQRYHGKMKALLDGLVSSGMPVRR